MKRIVLLMATAALAADQEYTAHEKNLIKQAYLCGQLNGTLRAVGMTAIDLGFSSDGPLQTAWIAAQKVWDERPFCATAQRFAADQRESK